MNDMNHPSIKRILLALAILVLFTNSSVSSITITEIITKNQTDTTAALSPSLTEPATQIIEISPQQNEIIRRLFDELQNRLSTSQTSHETQQIFHDMIMKLANNHLLPEDLSIQEAQRLVNTHHRTSPLPQRFLHQQDVNGTIQNTFCSVAGNTSNTHVAKLAKRIALRMYYLIDYNTANEPLRKLATGLYIIFNEISKINSRFLYQDGRHLGVCLYFGNYHYAPYPNWLYPAQGWIQTDGLNGRQNITGSFWGQTMTGGWQPQVDWYMNYSWRGCLGFSGLIYYSGTDTMYFLGSALAVNVGPNRP